MRYAARRRDASGSSAASSSIFYPYEMVAASEQPASKAVVVHPDADLAKPNPVQHSHLTEHSLDIDADLQKDHLNPDGQAISDPYYAAPPTRLGKQWAKFRSCCNVHVMRTVAWICLAGLSAIGVAYSRGRDRALEFLTAYIVEYSLSVDNLFVFLLIFNYFKVPREAQETVLFWGILGAMTLRGVMIVLGKALVERFGWVSIVFALLLLYSAIKLLLEDEDDEENLDNNNIVRFAKKLLPVTDKYHGENGENFFHREGGKLFATPLFVVLVSVELSDVVFALDSVPAVLGISKDALVIYASNILAVMGLRSLFFVVSDAITNLRFLKQSLSIVLGFIGVKMICGALGYHLQIVVSLAVVTGTLTLGIILSLIFPEPEPLESEESDPPSPKSAAQAVVEVPPPV